MFSLLRNCNQCLNNLQIGMNIQFRNTVNYTEKANVCVLIYHSARNCDFFIAYLIPMGQGFNI